MYLKQFFDNVFTGISIMDFIDVAIVAFIIYKILGFIRKSRAQQLVLGLVVLLAIALLSQLLKLYALNWIISTIFTMGVVAIVVIFQPELRRALEKMGRGTNLVGRNHSSHSQSREDYVTEQFVDAVRTMSESRTGALIVFERNMALDDICDTGIIVDSEITEELIQNIFYKGSPLHDGALVVRDDRLYAAACMLPLTDNPNLPSDLGTRHRAGIGISERADCLVIIVSEETGIVSLVEDGVILRNLNDQDLGSRIFEVYEGTDETSRFSPFNRGKVMPKRTNTYEEFVKYEEDHKDDELEKAIAEIEKAIPESKKFAASNAKKKRANTQAGSQGREKKPGKNTGAKRKGQSGAKRKGANGKAKGTFSNKKSKSGDSLNTKKTQNTSNTKSKASSAGKKKGDAKAPETDKRKVTSSANANSAKKNRGGDRDA